MRNYIKIAKNPRELKENEVIFRKKVDAIKWQPDSVNIRLLTTQGQIMMVQDLSNNSKQGPYGLITTFFTWYN